MKQWFDSLSAIVSSFWIGGLWITGLWAYVIFKTVPDQTAAGHLVGHIFNIMTYIGLYAGIFLLVMRFFKNGFQALNQTYFWAIVAILSLVLAEIYGVKPQIEEVKRAAGGGDVMNTPYADSFKMWHAVASVVYMVECVLGIVVVTKRLDN